MLFPSETLTSSSFSPSCNYGSKGHNTSSDVQTVLGSHSRKACVRVLPLPIGVCGGGHPPSQGLVKHLPKWPCLGLGWRGTTESETSPQAFFFLLLLVSFPSGHLGLHFDIKPGAGRPGGFSPFLLELAQTAVPKRWWCDLGTRVGFSWHGWKAAERRGWVRPFAATSVFLTNFFLLSPFTAFCRCRAFWSPGAKGSRDSYKTTPLVENTARSQQLPIACWAIALQRAQRQR